MRSAAEIGEIAVAVECDRLSGGLELGEQLELVGLPHLGEDPPGLGDGNLATDERQVLRGDALHLGLDQGQSGAPREAGDVHVVIEAVLYRRAYSETGAREEPAHCGGEEVRGAVPEGLPAAVVLECEDLDGTVALELAPQVERRAVIAAHQGPLRESLGYGAGNVETGRPLGILPGATIRKQDAHPPHPFFRAARHNNRTWWAILDSNQ